MAERKGLNRQTILDAAVQLVEEEGLPALSLQELARRLEVRTASLYNHIEGIGAVRQYITLFSSHELEAAIRDAAVGRSREAALEAVAVAYRDFAQRHPHLYAAYIDSAKWEDAEVTHSRRSVEWVLNQVLTPQADTSETLYFNRGFRSLLHGFICLEAAGFFQLGKRDESFRYVVRAYMAALPQNGEEACTHE